MIIKMILEAGEFGGIPLTKRVQRIFPQDLKAGEYGAIMRLKELLAEAERTLKNAEPL